MAKRLKALNISVPQWMKDFMKDNNMSPSRIVQDAVLAEHKRQLDEQWLRDLVDLQKEHKFKFTKG
jgi:post-segregation antitoxin (ccd killing protein)